MLKPNVEERRLLTIFFRAAAAHLGLYNTGLKSLAENAECSALFQKNLELLRELRKRVEPDRLLMLMSLAVKEGRKVEWISEVVPSDEGKQYETDRNLIRGGEHYVHRLLHVYRPPVSVIDIGAIATVTAPLSTNKESFTMQELLTLFCTTFSIPLTKDKEKPFMGGFNYLIEYYGLDSVLFAIDIARDSGAYLKNPLDLKNDYIVQAQEEVSLRKARV